MATTSASSMEFLEEIFHLMVQECLIEGSKQDSKVVEFLPPDKLKVDILFLAVIVHYPTGPMSYNIIILLL